MKTIALVALGVAIAAAHEHPVNHQIVNELKRTASWKVAEVHENIFATWSLDEIKGLMGTKLDIQPVDKMCNNESNGLPDAYNFYESHVECDNPVRNQA
jgi:hypothetical protein